VISSALSAIETDYGGLKQVTLSHT